MAHLDLSWDTNWDPELGILVATLQDSTREWRENLELPSPEAVIWSPYPNGPSIGGLILHMAAAEQYWISQIGAGIDVPADDPSWSYDSTMDQYVPHWPEPPRESTDWYFEIQDEIRVRMIEMIHAHGDPESSHATSRNTMTYRWILAHIIKHDSYSGGQAVLIHEIFKQQNR